MKKSESGLLILIMIMSIFIGLVGGFFIFNSIYNSKIVAKEENKITENVEKDDTTNEEIIEVSDLQYGSDVWKITFRKAEIGDVFAETIKPVTASINAKVKIVNKNGEKAFKASSDIKWPNQWEIIVNDKTVYVDGDYDVDTIDIHFTDKCLLYYTHQAYGKSTEAIYNLVAIDSEGNIIQEIHEPDLKKEMALTDVYFTKNSVIIQGERYIEIDPFDSLEFAKQELESKPAETPVTALYIYSIKADGTVDFTSPRTIVTETLFDSAQAYINNATDETEMTKLVTNWLDKNK